MTATAGRDDSVLRIATYNVHDFLDDRAAAARVVRAIAPDVLCLQEVPRRLTTEVRLPAFARECGLFWSGGRLGSGGTAILTDLRTRVHAAYTRGLPVRFPDRSRGYAAVDVSLPGRVPITVVSVHLGLKPDERVAHAQDVVARIGPRAVLAGDLNELSDGPAYRVLSGRYRRISDERATYPASHPTLALDVVFAGEGLDGVATGGPLGAPEDVVAGSDHVPVWIDVLAKPLATEAPGDW